MVLSILKEFDISTRVRAVTTDSGSEMPAAMKHIREELKSLYKLRLDEDWHVRCVCHIINRAVVDATKLIKDEVSILRYLLKIVCNSTKVRASFGELSVTLGISKKSIPQRPR
jgi:hypothetical protein